MPDFSILPGLFIVPWKKLAQWLRALLSTEVKPQVPYPDNAHTCLELTTLLFYVEIHVFYNISFQKPLDKSENQYHLQLKILLLKARRVGLRTHLRRAL